MMNSFYIHQHHRHQHMHHLHLVNEFHHLNRRLLRREVQLLGVQL